MKSLLAAYFPYGRGHLLLAPVFVLIVVFAVGLGARPGLAGLGAALQVRQTATPTRTPRPATPTPAAVALYPAIVVNNVQEAAAQPTPEPATPAARPEVAPTASPMPSYLAAIVDGYGMDPARRFVVIDQDRQLMTVWDPGQPVRELPVSTGDESRGYRTPAWYGLVGDYWGTFRSAEVYADDGWYLYEDVGSILVHGAPYRLVNGVKVYQELEALGNYPASRGCIRLSPDDARWFTEWNPRGVPLVVLPHSDLPG